VAFLSPCHFVAQRELFMARLTRLLGRSSTPPPLQLAPKQEDRWLVGARYEVLLPTTLRARPDPASDVRGHLQPKDIALVLALRVQGKVRLGYLASTQTAEWTSGWCKIEGLAASPESGEKADASVRSQRVILQKRCLRGSWQVGGRYRVVGSPVLRKGIELESDLLWECPQGEKAEVIVLDLGLVLLAGAPRLRAHVRTHSGHIGWLTLEGHGVASPLLDPLNLFTEEALVNGTSGKMGSLWNLRKRSNSQPGPSDDETWAVSGKYRTLAQLQLTEGPEFDSKRVRVAKKGALVYVRQKQLVARSQGDSRLRLQVSVENDAGQVDRASFWISPTSAAGEALVDFRDHLEFRKLLRSGVLKSGGNDASRSSKAATPTTPSGACSGPLADSGKPQTAAQISAAVEASPVGETWSPPFFVVVDRTHVASLGLEVDQQDNVTLVIDAINGGPLAAWNAANPEAAVFVGDRIVAVNGRHGDAPVLVEELSRKRVLYITLQRPCFQNACPPTEWAGAIGELPGGCEVSAVPQMDEYGEFAGESQEIRLNGNADPFQPSLEIGGSSGSNALSSTAAAFHSRAGGVTLGGVWVSPMKQAQSAVVTISGGIGGESAPLNQTTPCRRNIETPAFAAVDDLASLSENRRQLIVMPYQNLLVEDAPLLYSPLAAFADYDSVYMDVPVACNLSGASPTVAKSIISSPARVKSLAGSPEAEKLFGHISFEGGVFASAPGVVPPGAGVCLDEDTVVGPITPNEDAAGANQWVHTFAASPATASASTSASSPRPSHFSPAASPPKTCDSHEIQVVEQSPAEKQVGRLKVWDASSAEKEAIAAAWREAISQVEASPRHNEKVEDEVDPVRMAFKCGAVRPAFCRSHSGWEDGCSDMRPFCDASPEPEDAQSGGHRGISFFGCGNAPVSAAANDVDGVGDYLQRLFGTAVKGVRSVAESASCGAAPTSLSAHLVAGSRPIPPASSFRRY